MIYRLVILPPNFLWQPAPLAGGRSMQHNNWCSRADKRDAISYWMDLPKSQRRPLSRHSGTKSISLLLVNQQFYHEASSILHTEGSLITLSGNLSSYTKKLVFAAKLRKQRSVRDSTSSAGQYVHILPMFDHMVRFQRITLVCHEYCSESLENCLEITRFLESRGTPENRQKLIVTWQVDTIRIYNRAPWSGSHNSVYTEAPLLEDAKVRITEYKAAFQAATHQCSSEIRLVLSLQLTFLRDDNAHFLANLDRLAWQNLIESEKTDCIVLRICAGGEHYWHDSRTPPKVMCTTENEKV